MKSKRIISVFLAALMLLSLIPVFAQPAQAAVNPDPAYSRAAAPEVAFFNAYSGVDKDFYSSVISSKDYNAVAAGYFSGLKYDDKVTGIHSYAWNTFTLGNIYKLRENNSDIRIGFSVTRKSNYHKHSASIYTYKMTSYSDVGLGFITGGMASNGLISFKSYSKEKDSVRQGNCEYSYFKFQDRNPDIATNVSVIRYHDNSKTCSCGGTASDFMVCFYDGEAPYFTGLSVKSDEHYTTNFKPGDNINIILTCSEPIRFADDSASGKGDVYIGFKLNGSSSMIYAHLTKLDGNKLVFTYHVPEDCTTLYEVAAINLAAAPSDGTALINSDPIVPLKQVNSTHAFTASKPAKSGEHGITKTTSPVTDMAGNAVYLETARGPATQFSYTLYIDGEKPNIAAVDLSANTFNTNVKEARGVKPGDEHYGDKSDTYLGVGDKLFVKAYMNEVVTGGYATITTNVKKANGEYLVVSATPLSTADARDVNLGTQFGLGASEGKVSVLTAPAILIEEGMTIDDPEGKIRITAVTFSSNMKDKAGNVAESVADCTSEAVKDKYCPKQQYHIDTVGPEVTDTLVVPKGDKEGFYVQFKVTDNIGADGVAQMPASLTLAGDAFAGTFDYAVTASAEEPVDTAQTKVWKTGTEGTALPFIQTLDDQYLHVRLIDGQNYDVTNVIFSLSDYAGNTSTRTIPLTGVGMDSVGPLILAGGSSRSYDDGSQTGTLTAAINVSDPSGVNTVQYAWVYSTSPDAVPTVWQNALGTTGGATAAMSATAEVTSGNAFQQTLWVRATDGAGNVSVMNLGEYGYSLEKIEYALSYPTAVVTDPSLTPSQITSGGVLVFDVQRLKDADPTHYIQVVSNARGSGHDIFATHSSAQWYTAAYSKDAGGRVQYTDLTPVDNVFYAKLERPQTLYTGDLLVTVYSGMAGKDESSDIRGMVYMVGYDTYWDENWYIKDVDGLRELKTIEISSNAGVETLKEHVSQPWSEREALFSKFEFNVPSLNLVSTLEGVQVSIDLGEDINGWDFSDVDWDNSYIAIELGSGGTHKICGLGKGPRQTITLPASEYYVTGAHWLYLYIARRSVRELGYGGYRYYETNRNISIDTTEPGSLELGMLAMNTSYDGYKKLSYDPDSVVYIPTQECKPMLSVDLLDPDGTPHLANTESWLRTGLADIVAWRVDDPSQKVRLAKEWLSEDNGTVTCAAVANESCKRTLHFAINSTYGDATDVDDGILGLTPNQDTLIALQANYVNGRSSEIVYLTIHSVSIPAELRQDRMDKISTVPSPREDRLDVVGLVTADPGKAMVVYTPPAGVSTAGLTLYCQEGFLRYPTYLGPYNYYSCGYPLPNAKPVEMTLQSDGSYAVNVETPSLGTEGSLFVTAQSYYDMSGQYEDSTEPRGFYIIYAEDRYGNRMDLGITPNAVISDGAAPTVTEKSLSVENAEYTATFKLYDDSLLSAWYSGTNSEYIYPTARPMTLTLSYGDAYAGAIGTQGEVLTLTGVGDKFQWTPGGANPMGITEVTAALTYSGSFSDKFSNFGGGYTYPGGRTSACLTVTVKGLVSPKAQSTAMTLSLAATDYHGNVAEPVETNALTVTGAAPTVTKAEYKKTNADPSSSFKNDRALYLTFSAPVQPAESWINRSIEGFATEWHDAFPIWKDGTWDITFTDLFGTVYTQELTLDNVFGKYGIELDISTLDYVPASEGVTVSASKIDSSEFGDVYVARSTLDTPAPSRTFTENGVYFAVNGSNGESGYEKDFLPIHLNNIVSGGPDVTLFFYLDEFKEQYIAGAADQFQGTTFGPVTVSYRTSRETTPKSDTTVTLKGGEDAFSFQYYDAPTNFTYPISGKLSDYGITVEAPPEPYRDEAAPVIEMVTLWKQQGGGFVQAEAFPGSADDAAVEAAITSAGASQGYDFVVNASDYSAWKVLVKNGTAVPSGITFDSQSDSIDGVAVQGNNVLVTKDADDFYIVAVDHATENPAVTSDNFSYVKIPGGKYQFDTKAPEIVTQTVATSMYSKTVYIKVEDENDKGDDTSAGVTLSGAGVTRNPGTSGTDLTMAAYKYKLEFLDNDTTVLVTAVDAAGNSATATIKVTGIDVTAPVLSVTWSPCFRDPATGALDKNYPTITPVNTDVVAHITSNKEIYFVDADVDTGSMGILTYDFDDPANNAGLPVTIDYTSQRVTVHFLYSSDFDDTAVRLWVVAPNWKATQTTLTLGKGVIDKFPPQIIEDDLSYKTRDGYSVPYAATLALRPTEPVYCTNYGPSGELYYDGPVNDYNYLDVTFTDNTTEQTFYFVDKAGNRTIFTTPSAHLILEQIDGIAPTLTVSVDDDVNATNGAVAVAVTTDEACTLTASDASVTCGALTKESDDKWHGTVNATKNGTFRLTAADQAGNTATAVFTVGNIDRTLPSIGFSPSAVSLRQDSTAAERNALLDTGAVAWDNVGIKDGTLRYDASAVRLNTVGVYAVKYTVEDLAGNVGQAVRYVKIVDKNQPIIAVDGILTEANGMTSLRVGQHTLTVSGLKTANEPYTLKLVRGIWSSGQLKRTDGEIPVDENGSFTIGLSGFYTLYITTQSRQTYRTLLYVEN